MNKKELRYLRELEAIIEYTIDQLGDTDNAGRLEKIQYAVEEDYKIAKKIKRGKNEFKRN